MPWRSYGARADARERPRAACRRRALRQAVCRAGPGLRAVPLRGRHGSGGRRNGRPDGRAGHMQHYIARVGRNEAGGGGRGDIRKDGTGPCRRPWRDALERRRPYRVHGRGAVWEGAAAAAAAAAAAGCIVTSIGVGTSSSSSTTTTTTSRAAALMVDAMDGLGGVATTDGCGMQQVQRGRQAAGAPGPPPPGDGAPGQKYGGAVPPGARCVRQGPSGTTGRCSGRQKNHWPRREGGGGGDALAAPAVRDEPCHAGCDGRIP